MDCYAGSLAKKLKTPWLDYFDRLDRGNVNFSKFRILPYETDERIRVSSR
jgi:hypothetical protein